MKFAIPFLVAGIVLFAATSARAQTVVAPYNQNYSVVQLGSVTGVPTNYGGITFHPTNANVLLIGGAANGPSSAIYQVGVVRDAQQHITGFNGSATSWSTSPYIDGGLVFGPSNVLFATGWNLNILNEIPIGQAAPTKTINLTPLGIAASTGALQFVPPGYPGAGKVKIASYNTGNWYTAQLAPDGSGTFDLTNITAGPILGGVGPEGIIYPPVNSPFLVNYGNVIVCEYKSNEITVYDIDANSNPIIATRKVFITALTGAEGAVIDPVTGDFLFSTFGGGSKVIAVRGFAVPTCPGNSASYGTGTPGLGGFTPQLAVLGTPCVGNALSALSLSQGRGGALCVLFTGFAPANIPAPSFGGTMFVSQSLVSAFPIGGAPNTAGVGGFAINLPIPNDASIAGLSVYLQAVLTDAAALKGYSFSKGLQVTIG